jgi:hypothetical protein
MRSGWVSVSGWLGSLGVLAGAAFVACSGDTVLNNAATTSTSQGSGGQGGSGQGGGGGATTTSTTTTTSTGPMNTCTQGCEHASDCGIPVCDYLMIDCANPTPEIDCGAQCLLDANCLQILSLPSQNPDPELMGCLLGCQNGGQGGAGGGSTQACQTCLFQNNCIAPVQNCMDPDCQGWGMCASDCGQNDPQPACFDACDAQFPGAAPAYTQLYQCACTSCDMDCSALMDPCNQGSGGAGQGGSGMGGSGMGGSGGMP